MNEVGRRNGQGGSAEFLVFNFELVNPLPVLPSTPASSDQRMSMSSGAVAGEAVAAGAGLDDAAIGGGVTLWIVYVGSAEGFFVMGGDG